MTTFIAIPLDSGENVVCAVEFDASGPIKAGQSAKTIEDATYTLTEALLPITRASRQMLAQIREAAPDKVELEFGVQFTVAAGAVIAKTEASAHVLVKLTWTRAETTPSSPND